MKSTITLAALAASCLAIAAPALAQQRGPNSISFSQASAEDTRFEAAQRRFANEYALFQAATDRYRASRAQTRDRREPRYDNMNYDDHRDEGDYDPAVYYRDSPRYQERMLNSDERVYRGRDGRYYCKRSDGTTGLIVGAIAGATLGNLIDGGHSRSAGTLLGAVAGGLAGREIDRNSQLRCR